MRKMKILYLIGFIFFVSSCEQNEIAIDQHLPGEINSTQIPLGQNYSRQIFYNLKNNSVISVNQKTEWDLGFESNEAGWRIIINSATFSQLAKVGSIDFNSEINIDTLNWTWDNPRGINFGTAFGDYRNKEELYILDKGFNLDGSSRGYKKIMIDSVNNNSYFISYANIDNTNSQTIEIKKDNNFNFQYISFINDNIEIEPMKDEWDLVFTQYTHLFTENTETPAYIVTGVLTNYLNNIMVARDSINKFEDITLDIVDQYSFKNDQNGIGYEWKEYNFDNQIYSINSEINYIISDISGRYYKLHFTGFYNSYGEKGYPTFEIQEL